MKEVFEKLTTLFTEFTTNGQSQIEKGNKSAGQRARKISLEIGTLLKEFRKESVAADKESKAKK